METTVPTIDQQAPSVRSIPAISVRAPSSPASSVGEVITDRAGVGDEGLGNEAHAEDLADSPDDMSDGASSDGGMNSVVLLCSKSNSS